MPQSISAVSTMCSMWLACLTVCLSNNTSLACDCMWLNAVPATCAICTTNGLSGQRMLLGCLMAAYGIASGPHHVYVSRVLCCAGTPEAVPGWSRRMLLFQDGTAVTAASPLTMSTGSGKEPLTHYNATAGCYYKA